MRFSEAFSDIGQAHFPAGGARAAAIASRAKLLATMHGPDCRCGARDLARAIVRSAKARRDAQFARLRSKRGKGLRPFERAEHAVEVASYEIAKTAHVRNSGRVERAAGGSARVTFQFRPDDTKVIQSSGILNSFSLRSSRRIAEELAEVVKRGLDAIPEDAFGKANVVEWTSI